MIYCLCLKQVTINNALKLVKASIYTIIQVKKYNVRGGICVDKYLKPEINKTKLAYKDSYCKKANCSGPNSTVLPFGTIKPGK